MQQPIIPTPPPLVGVRSDNSGQQPIVPPPSTPPNPEPQKQSRLAGLKPFLAVVAFIGGIILAATLINQFIFQSYYVDGTSMTPTLQNNDRLIIDKVERTAAQASGRNYIPKRGQIVVLDSSLVDQLGHNEQLIKRVIGLPGDRVVIGSDGTVTIINKEHPDGYDVDKSLGLTLEPTYVDNSIDITVPDGQVFVMGDNRAPGGSYDSRAFGPVETKNIQGRLFARIFPFTKPVFISPAGRR